MGDIIKFEAFADEPDLDEMSREELEEYLDTVRDELERMDEDEPADMASESYDDWADRHEELEDLADEIQEHLDDLD